MRIKKKWKKYIPCTVVVLLILIINSYTLGETSCWTEWCFENSAKDCEDASYRTLDPQGYLVEFRTTTSCYITKQYLKSKSDSTVEMWKALQDKTMACSYNPEEFSLDKYEKLIPDPEKCEGGLLDVLLIIIMEGSQQPYMEITPEGDMAWVE